MLQIDYKYIPTILVDTLRRNPIRLDWLGLTTSGVRDGMTSFTTEYESKKFLAAHSSQVLSIEHLLNTILSPNTLITISDGIWFPETYIYNLGEGFSTPTYLYKTSEAGPSTYIYTQKEFAEDQVDFIVNVSNVDSALGDSIAYYVNKLLPIGKSYRITYF